MLARSFILVFVVAVLLVPIRVSSLCLGQEVQEDDSLGEEPQADSLQFLRKGRQFVNEGQFERAIRLLRPLFEGSSAARTQDEKQRVAYWLGRAYLGEGQSQEAFSVVREGGERAMNVGGAVDPQLADMFIQQAMSQDTGRNSERAARVYLRILGRSGENSLSDANRAIVQRHLREVAVVLPKNIQKQTGIFFNLKECEVRSDKDCEVNIDLEPDAGDTLVKWWRRQDPLPATRQNERIYEHLQRVVHARKNFSHEGRMDDRGKVYIRFGEPYRDVSIGMKHVETYDAIDTRLRRNVFWTYHHVHSKAYYLFVEIDPNNFQLGGVQDLFPPDMKTGGTGTAASARSRGKALTYLYEMEDALRQLATFHEDYMGRATAVADRAAWARDNEQYNIGQDPVDGPVGDFLQSMESRNKSLERQNAAERAEVVPSSYTTVSEELPDLPVASRTTRYLTPEGKTKIELYWSMPTSAFTLTEALRDRIDHSVDSSSTFMVRAVANLEAEDHITQKTRRKQFLLESSSGRRQGILPSQTFSMVTSDSLFHLAMQWDQFSVYEDGENIQAGPVLRQRTGRKDTLMALNNDPETLEMSDLKLLTVPDEKPATAVTSDDAIPYPFEQIRTEAPLALTFQLYHLGMDESDRTQYTVSYSVRHEADNGGFLGLFGGDDEKETTTTTTYAGDSRRADEYIVLNLDDFVGDSQGGLDVTVRVTDEVTGQKVERSISLETVASND